MAKPGSILRLTAIILLLGGMPSAAQWAAQKPSVDSQPAAQTKQRSSDRIAKASKPELQGRLDLRGPTNPAMPPQRKAEQEEDTSPPSILHEPLRQGTRGERIQVSANILDRSGVDSATLFCRNATGSGFEPIEMKKALDGSYKATIPFDKTDSQQILYYIEATDTRGNGPASMGSRLKPNRIHLDARPKQEGAPDPTLRYLSIFTSSILIGVFVMSARDRYQRGKALDALFWTKTLIPILHLPPEEITRKVTEMSRRPLLHPVRGEVVFPRIQILQKLDMVRRVNLNRLVNQRDKYIKQYMDVL